MILLYCIFIRLPQTGVVGRYIGKIHLRNFINFYFIKGTNLTDDRSVFFVPFFTLRKERRGWMNS